MPPPGSEQSSRLPTPGGGRGGENGPRLPTLLCNRCHSPLQTTCFKTACDCIFCEDCTYSHFQQSSSCPTCRHTLGENDFTELVIAESSSNNEISKISLQSLFSKQPGSSHSSLPYSELCISLVKQADALKQSTKFLLKQLIMDASISNHNHATVLRGSQDIRSEMTKLKQMHSSQRMELERINADFANKIQARERTIMELHQKIKSQEKMLDQFRHHHGNLTVSSFVGEDQNRRPLSSPSVSRYQSQQPHQQHGGPELPLRGLLLQKDHQKKQNRYDQQQKSALGNLMANRSGVPSHSLIRGPPSGNLVSASSSTGRPYSSSSTSLPNTPRIRELSSSSGYNFTSSGATSNAHINKRRRGGTPTSSFGTSRANSFLMGGDGSNAKYNPSRSGLPPGMHRRRWEESWMRWLQICTVNIQIIIQRQFFI